MKRLQSFDALRAVAALLVVFYHQTEVGGAPFGHILTYGWIGVDLFFVLSGFFIGLSILKTQKWSLQKFMVRRCKRIMPAYYLSMTLIIALASGYFLVTWNGLKHIFLHLTFLHPYSYGTHGSINGAYWSLGVEFAFYIVIGLSAQFIRDKQKFWWVIVSWVVIAWLWRGGCFLWLDQPPIFKFIWTTQLPGMLDEFALGLLVARIASDGAIQKLFTHKMILAIFFLISTFLFGSFVVRLGQINYWNDAYSVIFSRTQLAMGFALLLVVFLILENNALVSWLTKYSGMQYLGKISYSIYLLHLPILLNIKETLTSADLNSAVIGILSILMIILASAISYHFIEERFYHVKSKINLSTPATSI